MPSPSSQNSETHASRRQALAIALKWHIDEQCAYPWSSEPVDATQISRTHTGKTVPGQPPAPESAPFSLSPPDQAEQETQSVSQGTLQASARALELANTAASLEELEKAIAEFDGLMVRNTASHLVFADGNPEARVMVIGEAPGAEEDKQGRPFVGPSGKLIDKMLSSIDLARHNEAPEKAVYISNILNWRPPGNRTPTESELEISRPFIEKHIALIDPEIVLLCGGTAVKALLGGAQGITKRRGSWEELTLGKIQRKKQDPIPALPVFHPSYLLKNPAHKKLAWRDLLTLESRLKSSN